MVRFLQLSLLMITCFNLMLQGSLALYYGGLPMSFQQVVIIISPSFLQNKIHLQISTVYVYIMHVLACAYIAQHISE